MQTTNKELITDISNINEIITDQLNFLKKKYPFIEIDRVDLVNYSAFGTSKIKAKLDVKIVVN